MSLMGHRTSESNQIIGMVQRNVTYKEKELIVPLHKAIVNMFKNRRQSSTKAT